MSLTVYLLTVLIMSLFCVGLYATLNLVLVSTINEDTNSISEGLPPILRFFAKPILTCVNCYASVWGSVVFWTLYPFEEAYLFYWVMACVSCAYLNGLLRGLYNRFVPE